jgi:acyl carrier protein
LNTQEILKQFITQDLLNDGNRSNLSEDDNLLTSGLVDSLAIVRLITFIEERFDVQVPASDVTIENFRTINVIAGYLQQRTDSLIQTKG